RRVPLPDEPAVVARAQARGRHPAVVMDAGIGVAAIEMPRRLLDRLPRLGLRRPRRRRHGALADLGADVEDDDSLDQLGPLGREVHRGAPAHREPDQRERAQAELLEDTREVAEGAGRVVDVGGIAVAVAARVERHHVEVRLQRDGERVPGVSVAGEAVQQQQRRAAVAAPVQQVQAPSVDGEVALARAQEAHRSSWGAPRWPPRSFKRKGLRPPRTPPAIARTRPGGAVARLGLDTGWLIDRRGGPRYGPPHPPSLGHAPAEPWRASGLTQDGSSPRPVYISP